jgi:outer membrane lipoprotein-sorting protein
MLNRRSRLLVASLALATLAGCGTNPTGLHYAMAPRATRARAMDASSDAAVNGVKALQSKLNTFTATIDFWETNGKDVQTNTVNVAFAQPEKIRADITKSSDGMRNGASMVYLGGDTIEAKKFFIHQTMKVDDPKALSLRGYRIDQTDIKFMLGTITNAADTVAAGPAANVYEVTGPGLLPKTSREEVTLDPTTFAPVKIEFFDGNDSVYRIKLSSVKVNPTLPGNIFEL